MSGAASSAVSGYLSLTGANSAGVKVFTLASGAGATSSNSQESHYLGGFYNSATVISSVSLFSSSGNFDAGTVYIYTSA